MPSELTGSVFVELQVEGRWAISLLTKGWTDEEKEALLKGDSEARRALEDEASSRTLENPDCVEELGIKIDLGDDHAE